MRIDILTLFPEACEPFLSASILGRARQAGLVTIQCHNIRDHSTDPHKKVDDRPFGGGPGMVMMCQPLFDAAEALEKLDSTPARRLLLCPQGRRLDQRYVEDLARSPRLLLIAGHYEGFDDRVREGLAVEEVSIGDYVLSGGEAAAMVLVDAVVRLLPGALGHDGSAVEESFSVFPAQDGQATGEQAVCLEYPQFTRPRDYRGMVVPEVLLSGDHAKIRAWRADQAMKRTKDRRPDLLTGGLEE
ncbi:MAG: tRNA (guanosine(37)-N1)-methyltransferase TrmD [Planctomycetota bacterium]